MSKRPLFSKPFVYTCTLLSGDRTYRRFGYIGYVFGKMIDKWFDIRWFK